jgi:hypothetical protein
MHTDQTLDIFDNVTVQMGAEFRAFNNKTCPAFDTRELRRETKARKQRGKKRAGRKVSKDPAPGHSTSPLTDDEPLPKKFSLQTYKYHSLGDYGKTIRRLGTSDSYSTEPVSGLDSIGCPTLNV